MATNDPSDGIQQAVYGFIAVGSKAADGTKDAMTASWGTQVSFDPTAICPEYDSIRPGESGPGR